MMEKITARELKEKLEKGAEVTVIDIREEWEYEENHMPDSENIPMHQLPAKAPEMEELKEKEVVLYCNTGPRSITARQVLAQNGFSDVKFLDGGIEAWEQEG